MSDPAVRSGTPGAACGVTSTVIVLSLDVDASFVPPTDPLTLPVSIVAVMSPSPVAEMITSYVFPDTGVIASMVMPVAVDVDVINVCAGEACDVNW